MIRLTKVDMPQAFRYMGMHAAPDAQMQRLAETCEKRLLAAVSPRYIHLVCPIRHTEAGIVCGGTTLLLPGNDITAHLTGCDRAVLLCATLSAGADAAIRQAGAGDVLAGMMTDAMASALTEQLCDAAEAEILAGIPEAHPTWRFSPGYGDLPLTVQGDLLRSVNAEKRLGVTLSESGMLIPTKTVTAVIGLAAQPIPKGKRGCAVCTMNKTCPYRAKGVHCA